MAISRRGFLRGHRDPLQAVQFPPWSGRPDDFPDRCTRCGDCVKACPTAILITGDGAFPTVDFGRGECTFCGDCVAACGVRALRRDGESPWNLKAVIGDGCVARQAVECRVCGEACPVGAIRFRPTIGGIAQPQLDSALCTGCGACQAPCPVGALRLTEQIKQVEARQ
ncbi:ferredoxin-type protein NapF [Azoarcus sp. KH32C]|uniref:ferredoxin-type protein NapF n=1 Tax=Azoarcus sp. KH32C TaxID=748247 RepID=UPI00023868DF|nr:ferredoxin-type protein NapF [Azoarcus sp. KH32C]BAL22649.1 ferredoxin-type protein [Azoarcus sp. KH32C]